MMHTILGAGGAVGNALAERLEAKGLPFREVSRRSLTTGRKSEQARADLTNREETFRAVSGSTVTYLCAGLPYRNEIWKRDWPVIMRNVLDACIYHQSKLIFVDNVYMYADAELSHMTEKSAANPTRPKGLVRKELADMLLSATTSGKLEACIARSADFYGPDTPNSILQEMALKPLTKGFPAIWQQNPDAVHQYTYVPDIGDALILLAEAEDSWNRVWHLPTSAEKLTGKQWVGLIAKKLGRKSRYLTLRGRFYRFLGKLIPFVAEMEEMSYQYASDYIFDSSAFEERFGFKPTSPEAGIEAVIASERHSG